jgi:hypothetical protein
MNEDLTLGGPLVPGYAGHADAQARYLSDQQVRAWAGETLTGLQERISVDGLRDRFDTLLMHCEFGDQHVIRAIEDDRFGTPELAELVEAADRKVVAATNRLQDVGPEELDAALTALERAFEERAAAIAARLKR